MTIFLLALGLGIGLWWWIKSFEREKFGHHCHQLGSCHLQCPWCGVWGFFKTYQVGERIYNMCKWCGKVQDEGQEEPVKCYLEICPKCVPRYKELEKIDWLKLKEKPMIQKKDRTNKDNLWHQFTMKPGHPCSRCLMPMVKFEPKYNPNQWYKNELYEFHGYEQQ